MKLSRCCLSLVIALSVGGILGGASIASAAEPQVEGTPVPMPPKPDFSKAQYLIGTWSCSDVSSRRPGPFMVTEVYTMDPSGYWILRDDTIHKASWIPQEIHSQTRFTYDPVAKKFVRITYGDLGGYSIATVAVPTGNEITFTYITQRMGPDIASYAPEITTKVSDTKKMMTTSFTEKSGRVVTAKETCTKS